MNKKLIRLTEQDLHRIVKESVNRVLNEIDYSSIPTSGGYAQRNKWWKKQLDTDYPNHDVKDAQDWQTEYYKLLGKDLDDEQKSKRREMYRQKREREKQIEYDDYEPIIRDANKIIELFNEGEHTYELYQWACNLERGFHASLNNTKYFKNLGRKIDNIIKSLESDSYIRRKIENDIASDAMEN